MKKIFYSLMLLFFLARPEQAGAVEKAFIYDYDGNVVLMRDGVGQTLKSDMEIQSGDVLRTDTEGTIDILMHQIVGVRFQTASECVVVDIKPSSMHLQLNEGQSLTNLKSVPSGGTFTLETPNTIIETNLPIQMLCTVTLEGDQCTTVLSLKKGSVTARIKTSGAGVRVLENQSLEIAPKTYISPPRMINESEAKTIYKVNSIIASTDF